MGLCEELPIRSPVAGAKILGKVSLPHPQTKESSSASTPRRGPLSSSPALLFRGLHAEPSWSRQPPKIQVLPRPKLSHGDACLGTKFAPNHCTHGHLNPGNAG